MSDGLEGHLHHQATLATEFFWHRLRWRALQDHLPAAGSFTLLDVGSGNGVLGELLTASRPDASYLFDEPIESLATQLEERFGAAANHRTNPQWSGVDVVTLLDVIEHVDDPRALLQNICDHCRPGTLVVITVPASERLWSQWDVALGHHRRYTRRTLSRLLTSLPLEPIEISWLFPELVPPALWRAWRNPPREDAPEEPVAEFPELPAWINRGLYWLGLAPVKMRRWVPYGTSLIAAARIRGSGPVSKGAPS